MPFSYVRIHTRVILPSTDNEGRAGVCNGARDLLILNWFEESVAGRQGKGRQLDFRHGRHLDAPGPFCIIWNGRGRLPSFPPSFVASFGMQWQPKTHSTHHAPTLKVERNRSRSLLTRGQWPYRSAGSRAMKCDLMTTMRQWRMRMNYSVLIQITCN